MLHLLAIRCASYSDRLQIHHGDALTSINFGPQSFDLVVTHFFLDCLTQPQLNALVQRITSTLAPGALWLLSDFRVPDNALRIPARLFINGLYISFRFLTGLRTTHLPDHEEPLSRAGFSCVSNRAFLGGLLMAQLWQTGLSQNSP